VHDGISKGRFLPPCGAKACLLKAKAGKKVGHDDVHHLFAFGARILRYQNLEHYEEKYDETLPFA
jgi:hypothetical protein